VSTRSRSEWPISPSFMHEIHPIIAWRAAPAPGRHPGPPPRGALRRGPMPPTRRRSRIGSAIGVTGMDIYPIPSGIFGIDRASLTPRRLTGHCAQPRAKTQPCHLAQARTTRPARSAEVPDVHGAAASLMVSADTVYDLCLGGANCPAARWAGSGSPPEVRAALDREHLDRRRPGQGDERRQGEAQVQGVNRPFCSISVGLPLCVATTGLAAKAVFIRGVWHSWPSFPSSSP
jgi:hypothetical protein